MTILQTLEMALEALELSITQPMSARTKKSEAITALRQQIALEKQQPAVVSHEVNTNPVVSQKPANVSDKADEPVAWGVFEGNLHDMFFTREEADEMARLKGTHAVVRPLYTRHQPTAQCEKCKEWEAVCDQHLRHIKKLKKEKNT